MKPVQLNEGNFDHDVLQSAQPVIVDFWAEWCGPCKMLAPVLDEIARELEGKATIGKVNIDEHPALAERFQIKSIPTLLYFNGGELSDRSIGLVGKKAILTKLAALRQKQAPVLPA